MKKNKGRTLEGHLLDSLLEKNQNNEPVRLEGDEDAPDGLLDLSEESSPHLGEPTEAIKRNFSPDTTDPVISHFNDDKTDSILVEKPTSAPSKSSAQDQTLRVRPLPPTTEPVSTRVGFGYTSPGAVLGSTDAQLAQSESLRVAQTRISQLEGEIDRLRRENSELASAGELLRRKVDEMSAQAERIHHREKELEEMLAEEKTVYRSHLAAKDVELGGLRSKIEELELRLESDFKRIRVRERDLEHRLELLKLEHSSSIRSKDELILDLKRKIDQLTNETENYRVKGQDLYKQLDEKQETMRRVVRALRIALSVIEGEETAPLKKVD